MVAESQAEDSMGSIRGPPLPQYMSVRKLRCEEAE